MKKLRPILFSTPMVQAILEGRKTQTRRVVKGEHLRGVVCDETMYNQMQNRCPYGKVGDVLWVRESWNGVKDLNGKFNHYRFKGDNDPFHNGMRWKPSIHMPFEAARIFLEITDVRVQRLQHITPMDAVEEGIAIASRFGNEVNTWMCYGDDTGTTNNAYYSFMTLWQSINGRDSWYENPWVWVVEFKRIAKEEVTNE
jgi:hypothetical protein